MAARYNLLTWKRQIEKTVEVAMPRAHCSVLRIKVMQLPMLSAKMRQAMMTKKLSWIVKQ